MVDTVKESNVFPVNSNGEILLQSGTGDNVVAGYIPSGSIPKHTTTDKMVVKLPDEVVGSMTANLLLIESGVPGTNTGWLPTSPNPERFMARLQTATGGAAASITLDGSNDGISSAGQIASWALDTISVDCISPPLKPTYPFIKMTIVSAGAGTVRIGRGA